MPSRKRSNLSQCSKNAKRLRLYRLKETEKDREARLAAAREKQARARASEDCSQRESRLSAQRARVASSRSYKSNKERMARIAASISRNRSKESDVKPEEHKLIKESRKTKTTKEKKARKDSQKDHKASELEVKEDIEPVTTEDSGKALKKDDEEQINEGS